jgi:hypothetical protein
MLLTRKRTSAMQRQVSKLLNMFRIVLKTDNFFTKIFPVYSVAMKRLLTRKRISAKAAERTLTRKKDCCQISISGHALD